MSEFRWLHEGCKPGEPASAAHRRAVVQRAVNFRLQQEAGLRAKAEREERERRFMPTTGRVVSPLEEEVEAMLNGRGLTLFARIRKLFRWS